MYRNEDGTVVDYGQLAWIAGYLEGEGCFSIYRDKRRPNSRAYVVEAVSVDEDIIDKLQDFTGCGTIRTRAPRGPNEQVSYHWRCTSKRQVLELMEDILPWMGSRRQAKIKDILWEAMTRG